MEAVRWDEFWFAHWIKYAAFTNQNTNTSGEQQGQAQCVDIRKWCFSAAQSWLKWLCSIIDLELRNILGSVKHKICEKIGTYQPCPINLNIESLVMLSLIASDLDPQWYDEMDLKIKKTMSQMPLLDRELWYSPLNKR